MGTNFYYRKSFSINDQRKLLENIRVGKYDEAEELITFKVHIGKRSYGWKFLWNANNFEYFKPNKESITEFLKSGRIFDEYGKEFTAEQFWKEELCGFLDKGHDAESYEKEKPSSSYYYSYDRIQRFRDRFGIDVNQYGEFYIEGLRFTICDDFS